MKNFARLFFVSTLLLTFSLPSFANQSPIWVAPSCIKTLPMQGKAWAQLSRWAGERIQSPDLSDQDDFDNVRTLASALVFVRTGEPEYRFKVLRALEQLRGTERGARVLAVGRELVAYVIAADLIDLDGRAKEAFEVWLRSVSKKRYEGLSLKQAHEKRPNNWGTHAGASRIVVAAYLGDQLEIDVAAHVFKGWLGEPGGWRRFSYRQRWWQAYWFSNYAINPVGAKRAGHSLDGVLPEEMRRAGRFAWPPPQENYVYEALQGALTQAMLLDKFGYPVWSWGDQALLRAYRWLQVEANFPATGDDIWQIHVINKIYGEHFPILTDGRPGKGLGFTDWLLSDPNQPCLAGSLVRTSR